MLVESSVPYELFNDGILWSPISREGNKDVFVLSTSGNIVVRNLSGERLFFFTNSIVREFNCDSWAFKFEGPSASDPPIYSERVVGLYVQKKMVSNMTSFYLEMLSPGWSFNNVEISSNQGEKVIAASGQILRIRNIDPSQHLEVYASNSLIAFLPAAT